MENVWSEISRENKRRKEKIWVEGLRWAIERSFCFSMCACLCEHALQIEKERERERERETSNIYEEPRGEGSICLSSLHFFPIVMPERLFNTWMSNIDSRLEFLVEIKTLQQNGSQKGHSMDWPDICRAETSGGYGWKTRAWIWSISIGQPFGLMFSIRSFSFYQYLGYVLYTITYIFIGNITEKFG